MTKLQASSYRISICILRWVHTRARRTHRHGLICILPGNELVLRLIPVHTLDHLGSHERGLGDNSFQGHHAIELVRAKSSRVAGVFAKAADVGAVVHDIGGCLALGPIRERLHDICEGVVEGIDEIEGFDEEAA
jgi:hypothetical protein